MRKREVLFAAVIGGVIGAVLVMAAGSIAPLGAQNDVTDAEFGTITCRAIEVVDSEGNSEISIFPGHIFMKGSGNYLNVGREVSIADNGSFGTIILSGEHGSAFMGSWTHGGSIVLSAKDSQKEAAIGIGEHGGYVEVQGEDNRLKARMTIGEHGGQVNVEGKAQQGHSAQMTVNEHGGRVDCFGKGNSQTRATISVNEYGNGAVSTWDKNGYRLATLSGTP